MTFNIPVYRKNYGLIVWNGATFLWKYFPNFQEIILNIFIKASFETIFAAQVEFLTKDGNPTTTSFIRDIMTLPGVIISTMNGQEIGKTGIKYDGFSIIGTLSRGSCKAALLYGADSVEYAYNITLAEIGHDNISNVDKYALASRSGNYVCEYGLLAANYLSKARQLEITNYIKKSQESGLEEMDYLPFKVPYWYTYTRDNLGFDVFREIIPGAMLKAIIGDQTGEFIKWGRQIEIINKSYYFIDDKKNKLISEIFDVPELDSNDKIWTQIEKIHQVTDCSKAVIVDATILVSGVVYRVATEIIHAPIQITPARAGYALVEHGMKEYPIQTAAIISASFAVYIVKDELLSYVQSIVGNTQSSNDFQEGCIEEIF